MQWLNGFIESSVLAAWVFLAIAFAVLAKCADIFVDSSVSLANRLRLPKLLIGIVLVSIATTAPELSVSLLAAVRGSPEMAMGNAVGSVICNKGLGLALCAVLSVAAIPVMPHVLNTTGVFFLAVSVVAMFFVAFDNTLSRWEGIVLVALFSGYMYFLYRQHKGGAFQEEVDLEAAEESLHLPIPKLTFLFAIAIAGILLSSNIVITSATKIARSFEIPEAVIALTLVALGTSIPEVATCISAALKGHASLAVGNILGANIINICCVAGGAAILNPLSLERREVLFMFPAMFVIVIATFGFMRAGYRLTRRQGYILLALYAVYVLSFFAVFAVR